PEIRIEIETNGTVAPHPALDPFVAQYNVSPKLAHSGNPAELALIPERLAAWAADERAAFKFVIAQAEDVDQVLALRDAYAIPPSRIWLMPEGRDSATIRTRGRWLAEVCAQNEFNFSDRLHIHLYGDTRGT
ncbi:MAG: 7-carboxy-7-deazaguanine synthase QueE, partial [Novosphingobium sp.]